MSNKPSKFPHRPSPIVLQRQQSKKLMYPEDVQLTRQLSNFSNNIEGYHGGEHASVPFLWESQPGTPKIKFQENSLPPLTPPPSYSHPQTASKTPIIKAKNRNNSPRSSLLQTILFPKRTTRKGSSSVPRPTPPSESPLSLSYSSSSSSSSSLSVSPRPTSYSVPSSPMIHSGKGEEIEDLYDVPDDSSLCFGNARSRGCYSSMFKKALLRDFM